MKDLIFSVFNIFKYIGKFFAIIRNFFLNLLIVAITVVIIIALLPKKDTQLPAATLLRLDISGDIVEEKKLISSYEKVLEEFLDIEASEPETALQDILDCIQAAAADERIVGISLNLKNMGHGGINQLQSIGEALKRFKETGKPIVAAEDYYTQSQYFLACFANRIILHPMGGIDIHGFGVYRLYFKEAVEKLKVNYNVFKVGSYKSALEPFTRNSMSPADRQQSELWLAALWQLFTEDIIKERNISPEALRFYTDSAAEALRTVEGDTAQLAIETGLVDQIATRQETTAYLTSLAPGFSQKPNFFSSKDYLKTISPSYISETFSDSKVGLIIAEGNILPGKQPPGMIGGDSLANLIRKAREDSQVKALVLRINSGGGSAFASEIIRQEILELKKTGKPIVVSMGAVAASGGYWIAADADQIWASPSTITGSIGVFGAIPTFEKSLASLGIYSDGVGTTPLASGLNLTQPLPEQLKSIIQQSVDHNYDQFLQIVAQGRNIEKSKVATLAEGRVYDGRSAKTLGLVDELGSLENAITAAASLAGLTQFDTEYIRPPASTRDHFLRLLNSALSTLVQEVPLQIDFIQKLKLAMLKNIDEIHQLNDPRGIYAKCFHNLTW